MAIGSSNLRKDGRRGINEGPRKFLSPSHESATSILTGAWDRGKERPQ